MDDEPEIRTFARLALETDEIECDETENGVLALERLHAGAYDLVLLDIDMPRMKGTEVLQRLRDEEPRPNLKIIMCSGRASADEMALMLAAGADDYLAKPFSLVQLRARVQAALRLKEAQDRSDRLARERGAQVSGLEEDAGVRAQESGRARDALILALAELVAARQPGRDLHPVRLRSCCRRLAEEAAREPALSGRIDATFLETLETCAPLHDIGAVGLPDHLLHKPGRLNPEERLLMQAHTTIGADALRRCARRHQAAAAFLEAAADIARHHHERWDGTGYPDRLAGEAIPLAARIVSIADVYDALRCPRPYRPALSHGSAVQVMTQGPDGQFDPLLLTAFERCAADFERMFLAESERGSA